MKRMKSMLSRIRDITKKDLESKNAMQMFVSMVEEVGELARALKVELGISQRPLAESAKGECADAFICGIMMSVAFGHDPINAKYSCPVDEDAAYEAVRKSDRLAYLLNLSVVQTHIGNYAVMADAKDIYPEESQAAIQACFAFASYAHQLFIVLGGNDDQFVATVNEKLDKWEQTQKKLEGQ